MSGSQPSKPISIVTYDSVKYHISLRACHSCSVARPSGVAVAAKGLACIQYCVFLSGLDHAFDYPAIIMSGAAHPGDAVENGTDVRCIGTVTFLVQKMNDLVTPKFMMRGVLSVYFVCENLLIPGVSLKFGRSYTTQ